MKEISHKGPNQMVADMHKKRCIAYSEPPKRRCFKGSVVKLLTGSAAVNARAIYSNDSHTLMHATHIVLANNIPRFDALDDAVRDRLIIIPFRSSFYEVDQGEKNEEGKESEKSQEEKGGEE